MTGPGDDTAFDVEVQLAALYVHPIKSCGGSAPAEALLIETGLEFDRAWMVVDAQGRFVTQRQLPRMALIQTTLNSRDMLLRAPGMLAWSVPLDEVGTQRQVTVWNDEVAAFDMGHATAQWFSDFLGQPLRLVRFDPANKRLASAQWTGTIEAAAAFSDEYPLLVTSQASLEELNCRIVATGAAPVTMQRFRPNLVLSGLDAHGEDHLDEIHFSTPDGPVRLKLVKPCARCSIPDVDPLTAEAGHSVGDALAAYRADARLNGALTFGMNAVIVEGFDCMLRPGLMGGATYRFD
ncbi:MAG: MOSC domain-containing protein [Burkholderiales bacterium PBB1]|nr:MAG: MOSC domain-containing protein [Burkholderiales bacterium PBB1]